MSPKRIMRWKNAKRVFTHLFGQAFFLWGVCAFDQKIERTMRKEVRARELVQITEN